MNPSSDLCGRLFPGVVSYYCDKQCNTRLVRRITLWVVNRVSGASCVMEGFEVWEVQLHRIWKEH